MFNLPAGGRVASLLLLSLAATAPAHAATVLFGGATTNVASVVRSADDITLTVTAHTFTAVPNTLTSLSQLVGNALVSVTAPGIGVAGGASAPQVDTNQVKNREALLVTANKSVSISGLKLSYIDANDTLQIFGVNADGSLTSLGFDGTIANGLGGAASFVNSSANSGTTVLTFLNETAAFTQFLFTTRVGGEANYLGQVGQGYRIDSITANGAVPEPATWAMLITGFGLIGAAARRRRAVEA
ncbi:PEPxxWA-CTERM sorting domain-containing protein [Sandaracinobacter sp. RS1-74]|uniref:PEPxxWA-CTERM sorting domain-containing protein n=1 Tax=Sandaracinobacteroides sayramensis TaxID=2913411 RepID=UPI001EDBC273|nr:PEPxxWA-CTERM sorting domain-containing protein [Sandaracinobacteroides sayramensis]MCG2841556.1 PEPxxWA-CTERM sorting domain-containing protein [Sandaracinobacteroides sayramensis]